MITYLNGNLEYIGQTSLIIDVNGVGYEVFCSVPTLETFRGVKEKTKIYIHENIKEDIHDLYGFNNQEERELFRSLISVSGIGPKGGMQVLNTYESNEVIKIILDGDSKSLSKVSGIGPKTAQRIILELKDSMGKLMVPDMDLLKTGLQDETAKSEAVEALEALGYSSTEAKKSVEAIYDYKSSSEELIRKALSLLGM